MVEPKKKEIIQLSAKNFEPFDEDAQKALYDLHH